MSSNNPNETLNQLRAGKLIGIKRLDLSCELTTFPDEIFDLADSLEILNLSGNQLKTLPHDLTKLKNLNVIFCSENQFTYVPEVLGEFEHMSMVGFKANKIKHLPKESLAKKLRWLILTDNALHDIPAELGNCHAMQKLMLAGNQLSCLPDSLQACQHLELLRISANQFKQIPNFLLDMPRLAWLALAGNPFSSEMEKASLSKNATQPINWQALTFGQRLGEGASGVIYQATLDHTSNHTAEISSKNVEDVAVKLFKGNVTSDGLPESEMAAWFSAGNHPHLTKVKGPLIGHPEQQHGLIMPLIAADYKALASPPSLSSCTRDVYDNNQKFNLTSIFNVALAVARATNHLHQQGLLHGDLYAHNILHRNFNDVLLSDFGGASFLPQQNQSLNKRLQKIEVRAFTCLLDELISRCAVDQVGLPQYEALVRLQSLCDDSNVSLRPLFSDIVKELELTTN